MKNVNILTTCSRRQLLCGISAAAFLGLLPNGTRFLTQKLSGASSVLKPDWQIIISSRASKVELFAAEELKHYIHKLIGYDLKIIQSDAKTPTKSFIIGRHDANRNYFKRLDTEYKERPDSFALIVQSDLIRMVGVTPIATCYAVWEWLESLGVRWIFPTPKGEYIPSLELIETTSGEYFFSPDINQRWIWPFATGKQADENHFGELEHGIPAWNLYQCRLRSWGNTNVISPEDRVANIGMGHSYFRFLPAKRYFDKHPEWFNLIDGKRVSTQKEDVQVCFTNKEAAGEFAKNVISEVQKMKSENYNLRRMRICIIPNDSRAWCECAECQRLVDKDGSATSMVVHFTNLVARNIAKVLPDATLLTLAYWNHSTPPDHVRADPNVAVQITQWPSKESFFFNNSRPGLMESGNPKFLAAYQQWSKMCSNVYVYPYYGHFVWWTPFPMRSQMDYDYKRHVKNPSFKGFNCEYRSQWANQGIGMYAIAKLGWDTSLNMRDLQKDYCMAAFGKAGDLLDHYYNTLQDAIDKAPRIGGNIWHLALLLKRPIIDKCNALIAKARALMPEMDESTRWRVDLVTSGWGMSAKLAEAVLLLYKKPNQENLQRIRMNLQAIEDYIEHDKMGAYLAEDRVKKTHYDPYIRSFLVPLESLPIGNFEFRDNMNHGGSSQFHATKIENLQRAEWGYNISAETTGSFIISVKAKDDRKIRSLSVRFKTRSKPSDLKCELVIKGAKAEQRIIGDQVMNTVHDLSGEVLNSSENTFELKFRNVSSKEMPCLSGVVLTGEVV